MVSLHGPCTLPPQVRGPRSDVATVLRVPDGASQPRRLFTYAEVAEYLNVGVTTAKRLARDGEIPKVHIAHSVRFEPADLDAYIKRRKAM